MTVHCCVFVFILVTSIIGGADQDFKAFDINENWKRAKTHCKGKHMKLAQIDNGDLFNWTKARFLPASSTKKFWTGLKHENKKLLWSNGKEAFCNTTLRLRDVVDCASLKNLSGRFCFLITGNEGQLTPSNCNVAQRFICQKGKLYVKIVSFFIFHLFHLVLLFYLEVL